MKSSDMFNRTPPPFPSAFTFCLQCRITGCLHLPGGNPCEAPKSTLAAYNLGVSPEVGGSGTSAAKIMRTLADCMCRGEGPLEWGFTTHHSYGYLFPLASRSLTDVSLMTTDMELSSSDDEAPELDVDANEEDRDNAAAVEREERVERVVEEKVEQEKEEVVEVGEPCQSSHNHSPPGELNRFIRCHDIFLSHVFPPHHLH